MDVSSLVGVSWIKSSQEFYLFRKIKAFKTDTGAKLCIKYTPGCNEVSGANTCLGLSILTMVSKFDKSLEPTCTSTSLLKAHHNPVSHSTP